MLLFSKFFSYTLSLFSLSSLSSILNPDLLVSLMIVIIIMIFFSNACFLSCLFPTSVALYSNLHSCFLLTLIFPLKRIARKRRRMKQETRHELILDFLFCFDILFTGFFPAFFSHPSLDTKTMSTFVSNGELAILITVQ